MDTLNLPLPTRDQLLVDSITSINAALFQESLKSWSKKGIQQVKMYIDTIIQSRWKYVQKEPSSVETFLKDALVEFRKNWKDPKQKVMPSFETAIFALIRKNNLIHSFTNNTVVFRFIEVGIHLIVLVEKVVELYHILENFKSFQPKRNDIVDEIKQLQDLIKKPATGEIHKSLKKLHPIQRSYVLLLSVVPKSLEIIESIVKVICASISNNVHLTEDEIGKWLEQMKEEKPKADEFSTFLEQMKEQKPNAEYTFHFRFDHYFTGTVVWKIVHEEEVTVLNELIEEQAQKIDDQEKEIIELKRLLVEKSKRNDDPGSSCEASGELCTLLQLGREQAKQANAETKFETNFSTSNFAYGVFDSKGGKLSVENGDAKLLIPDGALSSEKEIYIYVDPKARFSKLEDSSKDSSETRLAPIVQCGPPGTTFLSHVILTIPHNACDEEKWQFTPVRSDGGRRSTQNWKKIDETEEDDDSIVIVDGGVCVFMIKHFTRFTALREQNS